MNEIPFESFGKIDQELLKRFSVASGDLNEIHLNEDTAKKMGLPGVIAHGMLIAGYISSRAQSAMRGLEGNYRLVDLSFRFKAMTFLGEEVLVGGNIQESDGKNLKIHLQAVNGNQEVKTEAVAQYTKITG